MSSHELAHFFSGAAPGGNGGLNSPKLAEYFEGNMRGVYNIGGAYNNIGSLGSGVASFDCANETDGLD
jgi:hypothetical protein